MMAKPAPALHDQQLFVLRAPLLPLNLFRQWQAAADTRQFVRQAFEQTELLEALYLASPSLYERYHERENLNPVELDKLYFALGKYLARAAYRCTPFGMFATITPGVIAPDTDASASPLDFGALEQAGLEARVRFDFAVQAKIVNWLLQEPGIRGKLNYQRNNSLSFHGTKIYYVEGIDTEKRKQYHFNQVERESYLDNLLELAETPQSFSRLCDRLIEQTGATHADAQTYLYTLIDNELLTPDLGILITADDAFTVLLERLDAIGERERLSSIEAALVLARQASSHAQTGRIPILEQAYQILADIKPLALERKNLFQVDSKRPAAITLSKRMSDKIATAASSILQLTMRRTAFMDDFKRTFNERYEDQEIALEQLFNEEIGIPFPRPGKASSDLLQGITFGGKADTVSEIQWGAFDKLLFRKFEQALIGREREICFDAAEVEQIFQSKADLPAMQGGVFVNVTLFAGEQDQPTAYIHGIGGRTGVEMLGRFCDMDQGLCQQVRAIIAAQDRNDDHAVYAEIVHLPQDRIVNVVARPALSEYEIPYLGSGSAPPERQILLSDLMISLKNNRFVLRSQRLNKEVVPRLTSMHNVQANNVNLYAFLASLTWQDRPIPRFEWPAPFAEARYLPRLCVDGIIFSLARWRLQLADIDSLKIAALQGSASLCEWRKQHDMLRFVSHDSGDNTLPVDLENPLLVQILLDEIDGLKTVELKEVPALNSVFARGNLGAHNNEISIPYRIGTSAGTSNDAGQSAGAHKAVALPLASPQPPHLYLPGSEWQYFKIYCGQSQVDELLTQHIVPLMHELAQKDLLQKWFFIRYADPEPHVRIRILSHNTQQDVHAALSQCCANALRQGFGRRVVVDSYRRELGRYGGVAALEQCETIFHLDSQLIHRFIASDEQQIPVATRWLFAAMSIPALLDAFGLELPEQAALMATLAESFRREFVFGAQQKVQLGAKYRSYRNRLDGLIFGRGSDAAHAEQRAVWQALLQPYRQALQAPAGTLRALEQAGELSTPLHPILGSLIHMHCNRLFVANQRMHEAVLYDFMERIYDSRLAALRQR
jgi:thiopeptide-type bacteriocin biosynthesis protein